MIKSENFKYMALAVEIREVVRLVESASSAIAHKVKDVTSFEHTCYVSIGKEMARRKVTSIKAMAIHYIKRAEARHVKRSMFRHGDYLEDLGMTDSDGQLIMYEPRDDLAIVDTATLEIKETINLLAKADRRKQVILSEWANGNTNDSDISNTLARILGGQARSHCRYIQRFRIECRAALSAV